MLPCCVYKNGDDGWMKEDKKETTHKTMIDKDKEDKRQRETVHRCIVL